MDRASLRQPIIRGEKGQALIAILLLMVLGSVLLVPVLSYSTTIIKLANASRDRVDGFYAADSGVEYGLWLLRSGPIAPPLGLTLPQPVNGLDVDISIVVGATEISTGDTSDYDITATASKDGDTVTRVKAAVMQSGAVPPHNVWIEVWDVLEHH